MQHLGVAVPAEALTVAAVQTWETQIGEPRRRAREFWAYAQRHFVEAGAPQLRGAQDWGGMDRGTPDWRQRVSAFIGGTETITLLDFMNPPKPGVSRKRIFSDRSTQEALAWPCYDMPGRVSSWILVGMRAGDTQPEIIVRASPEFAKDKNAPVGLPLATCLAERAPDELTGKTFLFGNPVTALRMQVRWLRTHVRPLPVAALPPEPHMPGPVWDWVRHSGLICWNHVPSARLLEAAQVCDAPVSLITRIERKLDKQIGTVSSDGWLKLLARNTTPWDAALRKMLRTLPDAESTELLLQLKMSPGGVRRFIQTSMPDLRERLLRLYDGRLESRRVQLGSTYVIDEPAGWRLERTGELIADFSVRLTQSLQTTGGRAYYQGSVLHNGVPYDFIEAAELLEKDLWGWARDFLRQRGAGVAVFEPRYQRQALRIALALHTPQVVRGVDVVGWDEERRQLNFPKFSLLLGSFDPAGPACLPDVPGLPGFTLEAPEPLTKPEILALSAVTDETAIVWAVMACALSAPLARPLRRSICGLALAGAGAAGVGGAVLAALGCVPQPADAEHDWLAPFGGKQAPGGKLNADWVASAAAKRSVVTVSPATAAALLPRVGWHVVRSEARLGALQLLSARTLARFASAYLQSAVSRRFALLGASPHLVDNVLTDMTAWFIGEGGDPAAGEAARKLLAVSGPNAAALAVSELLADAWRRGMLRRERRGFDAPSTTPAVIDDGDTTIVPQHAFSVAVERMTGLLPDLLLIGDAARSAGALVDEVSTAHGQAWVFKANWLSALR